MITFNRLIPTFGAILVSSLLLSLNPNYMLAQTARMGEQVSEAHPAVIPVLANIKATPNFYRESSYCISIEESGTGVQRNFCGDLELDASSQSSGQFQLQWNLDNMNEGLVQQVRVQACVTLFSSPEGAGFRGAFKGKCSDAVFDLDRGAYIADIDFMDKGGSRQDQGLSQGRFLTYKHPVVGFSIEYPEGLEGVEFRTSVGFIGDQVIHSINVSPSLDQSLDQFVADYERTKEEEGMTLINKEITQIAGEPVIRNEYYGTDERDDTLKHVIAYYAIFGSDGYFLNFERKNPSIENLDDFLIVVNRMLNSIQFPL